MKTLYISITALLFSMLTLNLHAEFIDTDLHSVNDTLVTLDTVTGLEWLDISETASVSYDDIRANTTGLFDLGFRISNAEEISSLFDSAGIVQGPPRDIINAPGVQLLIDHLGCNLCFLGSTLEGGSLYYFDEVIESTGSFAHATYSIDIFGEGFASVNSTPFSFSDIAASNISTFLVRGEFTTPVPVPAAIWLFGSGFIMLIGINRFKLNKTK